MTLLGPDDGQHMCTYCSGKPVKLIWSPLALQYSTIRMVCNICECMWLCHGSDGLCMFSKAFQSAFKPSFYCTSSRRNAFTDLNCSLHKIDMLGMCVMDWQSVLSAEQQILLHSQVGVHDVILQHASVHCLCSASSPKQDSELQAVVALQQRQNSKKLKFMRDGREKR